MALNKRVYIDGLTCITAKNLNDIQDAVIALEGDMGDVDAALYRIIEIQEALIGGVRA